MNTYLQTMAPTLRRKTNPVSLATTSGSSRPVRPNGGGSLKKETFSRSGPLVSPRQPALKDALKALNEAIHETLATGVRPDKAAVGSMIAAIQTFSKEDSSFQAEMDVLVEGQSHLCDLSLRHRILMLNAIQALLWKIDAKRS